MFHYWIIFTISRTTYYLTLIYDLEVLTLIRKSSMKIQHFVSRFLFIFNRVYMFYFFNRSSKLPNHKMGALYHKSGALRNSNLVALYMMLTCILNVILMQYTLECLWYPLSFVIYFMKWIHSYIQGV